MTLEQLEQLRNMLGRSKRSPQALHEVMTFFRDHTGDELDVLKLAESTTNPFLYDNLQSFASEVLEKPVVPTLILACLPSYHFYYGPFVVEGLYGRLFYFSENLGKGLIGMPSPDDPTVENYRVVNS